MKSRWPGTGKGPLQKSLQIYIDCSLMDSIKIIYSYQGIASGLAIEIRILIWVVDFYLSQMKGIEIKRKQVDFRGRL